MSEKPVPSYVTQKTVSADAKLCQFCDCETQNAFACDLCAETGPSTRSLAAWIQKRFPNHVREWVVNEQRRESAPTDQLRAVVEAARHSRAVHGGAAWPDALRALYSALDSLDAEREPTNEDL